MGQGSPCCPYTYKTAQNPPLERYGCPRNMFCNYDFKPAAAKGNITDSSLSPAFPSGTCEINPSDCGQFGKACCIYSSGAATGTKCGAEWGQPGQKGYCANPPGFKGPNMAPYKDQICTRCPDRVDSSAKETNPSMYFSCQTA